MQAEEPKGDKSRTGLRFGGEKQPFAASIVRRSLLTILLGLPIPGLAATDSDEVSETARPTISVDEIALELSNPVTALRSLTWDIEGTAFQGSLPDADEKSAMKNIITFSWPFKLKNGNNLLLSATIPHFSDQPIWELAWWDHSAEWRLRQREDIRLDDGYLARGHDHLDDIGIDVGYGGVSDSGFIHMLGLSTVFPTSEDGTAKRAQLLMGPEFILGKVASWGLYGAKIKHLTDVGGEGGGGADDFDWSTSETTAELFFAYAMGNGWQIESNPIILYDWEAISDHEWTIPIGVGVSKTLRLGRVPMKFAFDLQKYLVSPDRLGPDWQLTLSITPVFSTTLLK